MISKDIIINLNFILEKNDLSLANDFEHEFYKLIKLSNNKKEISRYKKFGKKLVKNAYYLIISLYGEKATISDFKTLITNENNGKEMIVAFKNKNLKDVLTKEDKNDISVYLLNDYYNEIANNVVSNNYENTKLVRKLSKEIVH